MYSKGGILKSKRGYGLASNRGKPIGMGYVVIVLFVLIFFVRAINVVRDSTERGGFAYVQLLNYSMPVVKNQIYDESAYVENKLSIKNISYQALGLDKINTFNILGKEMALFNNSSLKDVATVNTEPILFKPFVVSDNSIAKLTPEEIAKLNEKSVAYDPTLKKPLDSSKPEVLIYHTHTLEGYAEKGQDTADNQFNVVAVGSALAKELEENYGISVIHDTTNHSVIYNNAYIRSGETLNNYLNKYGDFKLIIDLHRDSYEDVRLVNLNGKEVAPVRFVTAQNSSRYDANTATVNNLKGISDTLFPGFINNTYVYPIGQNDGFNQGYRDNSVLLEAGTYVDKTEQVLGSVPYIARVIAESINR